MAQHIHRLEEAVINQIAAGEVVESPASVVKELIENSIDAGARHISVEVIGGGLQSIVIEDDGIGMSREDVALCLERHATSKLRHVDDLSSLQTMGFRGEALAAIASVSLLEMISAEDRSLGSRLVAEGGATQTIEPAPRTQGTSIWVRSLFFNVHARRKFQKSVPSLNGAIRRAVETIALAHPDIAFTLKSGSSIVVDLKRGKPEDRIQHVLGQMPHLVRAEGIWGFVGAPEMAGPTRTRQYCFVNRRPLNIPIVSRAVQAGFATRIKEGLHPPFVLFLSLDPDKIDVNVHPQKKEARFVDEKGLFRLVEAAVSDAFGPKMAWFERVDTPFVVNDAPWEEKPLFELPTELPIPKADQPIAVFGRHLLVDQGRVIVVDLARAKARILFEAIASRQDKQMATPLALPFEGDIHDDFPLAAHKIGPKSIAIEALPDGLDADEVPQFLQTLPSGLPHACRCEKTFFSMTQAVAIWERLQKCQDTLYDPLGRPIWRPIDWEACLR
ncbi:MAG: hypothetical protein RL235_872 [Chlamydiota bacterium]|jgi:DNA mismatch repair protein MutL